MRHDPQSVMLFAAGFGTRMGKLTAQRPKPMINVAGKPLIDHALDLVAETGISRKVVNLHYKPEMLREHLADRDVALSIESPDILETGGGLRHALPLLGDGPVFTMNTDAVWKGPNPLVLARDAWNPDIMDGLLMCVPQKNALGHEGQGDFIMDEQGILRRGPDVIYGGVQIIKTMDLAGFAQTAFSLNLLWTKMLESGRLFGLRYPGQWCDVGNPEGIALAEEMIGYRHV